MLPDSYVPRDPKHGDRSPAALSKAVFLCTSLGLRTAAQCHCESATGIYLSSVVVLPKSSPNKGRRRYKIRSPGRCRSRRANPPRRPAHGTSYSVGAVSGHAGSRGYQDTGKAPRTPYSAPQPRLSWRSAHRGAGFGRRTAGGTCAGERHRVLDTTHRSWSLTPSRVTVDQPTTSLRLAPVRAAPAPRRSGNWPSVHARQPARFVHFQPRCRAVADQRPECVRQ